MKKRLAAGFISILLMFGGCTPAPVTNGLMERQELKVDPEVMYAVSVTELLQERIPQPDGSSLLQVQFSVDARADADLAWKITWFDDSGIVVKGVGESYRKAKLLLGQSRYFKATAPHPRVTAFQLHLREPK